LSVKAQDRSKVYGNALTLTQQDFTTTGLVSGDLAPVITISSDGTPASANAGKYPITVSGGVDSNYSFTYLPGVLTVEKADQVITFAEIPTGLRTSQHYQLVASASSGLPVSFEVSDPTKASVSSDAVMIISQEGNFIITASQEGDLNWNPAVDISRSAESLPTFDNITSLFTPNNDGMNDYWYIPHLEEYGNIQVTVYNRYGQAVYRSESYSNDWDGTWNGYPLPSATYYYIIKSSVRGVIKGVVNIVR
jgi:gliding motility-associated-like protein